MYIGETQVCLSIKHNSNQQIRAECSIPTFDLLHIAEFLQIQSKNFFYSEVPLQV